VLDFAGVIANGSSAGTVGSPVNVSFSVSDGSTTVPVVASKTEPFQVKWATFTVGALPPPNNACSSALALASLTQIGLFTYATNDGTASCDPGGAASQDLWYSFTAGIYGGTLSLDTCGSLGVDTVLSVHASCGGAELACNDDCGGAPCGGSTSCLSVALTASQVVKIRVSDKGLGGGNFVLNRTFVPNSPTNDDCSTPLTAIAGLNAFDNTTATTSAQGQAETLCTFFGFTAIPKDVWYTFAPTTNGTVTVTTCPLIAPGSPSTDTKIAVYAGTACPTMSSAIACNDDDPTPCPTALGLESLVTFTATCGTTYLIQLGMYGGSTSSAFGQFSITETGGSLCGTPFTVFCDGSAVGTTCIACGNNGSASRGCANSMFAGGTMLVAGGTASIGADTLTLTTTDMTGPGLFFQANGLTGTPLTFGDGMLCASVGIQRLGVVFPVAGSATYPGGLTPNPISIGGGPISAGNTKRYQCWYRDSAAFCTTSSFNTSNGVSLTWTP